MRSLAFAIVCAASLAPAAYAQEDPSSGQDPTSLFFEGLDLVEGGDCAGAIARFQMAIEKDPDLHQARLYSAECYEDLGFHRQALDEAEAYLGAQFPGAQVDRARDLAERLRSLVEESGSATATATETATETATDIVSETVTESVLEAESVVAKGNPPRPRLWAIVRLEGGASVAHVANEVPLTAGGPLVAVRVLPWQYLEIGARVGVAFAGYPGESGTILVPELAPVVSASIPVGRVRIVAGISVPLVLSRYGGASGVVAGVRGEAGLRFVPPGSRLVLGAQVEGGVVARPAIGGSIRFGVMIGRRENADAQ